jgi:hypothetical protein
MMVMLLVSGRGQIVILRVIPIIAIVVIGRRLILDALDVVDRGVVGGHIVVMVDGVGRVDGGRRGGHHRFEHGAGDQRLVVGVVVDDDWFGVRLLHRHVRTRLHGQQRLVDGHRGCGHDHRRHVVVLVVVFELRGRVNAGVALADHGVEAVDGVGGVVDGAHRAVRLHQTVLALDHVAVARLRLALLVACVRVVDAVVERVLRVRLQQDAFNFFT